MKLKDANGNDLSCDPFLYYQGLTDFCPNGVLQHPTDNQLRVRVASTVGPLTSEWNLIHGTFKMTDDMLSWPKLEVFFGWARAGIEIVIDDVSIKPLQIDNDCLQLVKNGDAEVGDARHWFLRGSGDYGTLSVEPGGAGGSAYAFHHKGTRSRINQGIWQELDKSCMPLNSEWKIYSSFKFFDKDGTPTDCYNQNSATCVKWRVESYNGDGKQIFGKYLDNDKIGKGEWVVGSWNDYESTFTISKQFDDRERIFIYVVAPIGYTYMVDNIRVLKSASSNA